MHLAVIHHMLVGCLYVSQILKEMGISPMVDGCVVCDDSKVSAISLAKVDLFVHVVQKMSHQNPMMRIFRDYSAIRSKLKWQHLSHFSETRGVYLELLGVFVEFFKDYTSIPLKSWEFLRKL
jgi:uncharacterized protein YozE (UPF0346 family)